jgi:hypothetical protein
MLAAANSAAMNVIETEAADRRGALDIREPEHRGPPARLRSRPSSII